MARFQPHSIHQLGTIANRPTSRTPSSQGKWQERLSLPDGAKRTRKSAVELKLCYFYRSGWNKYHHTQQHRDTGGQSRFLQDFALCAQVARRNRCHPSDAHHEGLYANFTSYDARFITIECTSGAVGEREILNVREVGRFQSRGPLRRISYSHLTSKTKVLREGQYASAVI